MKWNQHALLMRACLYITLSYCSIEDEFLFRANRTEVLGEGREANKIYLKIVCTLLCCHLYEHFREIIDFSMRKWRDKAKDGIFDGMVLACNVNTLLSLHPAMFDGAVKSIYYYFIKMLFIIIYPMDDDVGDRQT